MNREFIVPVIVLSLICLFVSGILAVCNSFTLPVIESAAEARAEAARRTIIPEAAGFELLKTEGPHGEDGLPRTITAVYRTTNNLGYIFMITTMGYGGEIKLICGIDPDGKIIGTATLFQTETKGIATPVFEKPFQGQFTGRDKNLEGVSAISGATISSMAYKHAVEDAFTAYEYIRQSAHEWLGEELH